MEQAQREIRIQSETIDQINGILSKVELPSWAGICSTLQADFSVLSDQFTSIRQNGERLQLKKALSLALDHIKNLEKTIETERAVHASKETFLVNKIQSLEESLDQMHEAKKEEKSASMKVLERKYLRLSDAYESLLSRNKKLTKSFFDSGIRWQSSKENLDKKLPMKNENQKNQEKEKNKENVGVQTCMLVSSESQTDSIFREKSLNKVQKPPNKSLKRLRPKSTEHCGPIPNWNCSNCQRHHSKELICPALRAALFSPQDPPCKDLGPITQNIGELHPSRS
jgi:hypothetical protein